MNQIWTDDPEGLSVNLAVKNAVDIGTAKNPLGTVYAQEFVGVTSGLGKGTVTLNGATPVSVANTSVTADSVITFTLKTVGGTPGATPTATLSPGTGFSVKGTAGDTSVYNYAIL